MKKLFFLFALVSSIFCVGQTNKLISPNAISIDAEDGGVFLNGMSVVHKGELYSIIDKSGNAIIPYTKSNFVLLGNGYLVKFQGSIETAQDLEIIDCKTLKSKFKCKNSIFGDTKLIENGAIVREFEAGKILGNFSNVINQKFTYSGQTFQASEVKSYNFLFSKIAPLRFDKVGTGYLNYWGFCDYNGKVIIPPIYLEVGDFSEGICAVSKKNQFGEVSWGFIDETGKVVIDFLFTYRPHNMHNSVIRFQAKEGFKGFLDKNSNLLFQSKFESALGDYEFGDMRKRAYNRVNYTSIIRRPPVKDFCEDIAFEGSRFPGGIRMIDLKGNKIYSFPTNGIDILSHFTNGLALIEGSFDEGYGLGKGMINKKGQIVIPTVFEKIGPFDPETGLSYATVQHSKEFGQSLSGYVNTKGQFVIVFKPKSSNRY